MLETGIFIGRRSSFHAECGGLIARLAGYPCQRAPISCQNFQHLSYFAMRLEPFSCGPLKRQEILLILHPLSSASEKVRFLKDIDRIRLRSPGVNNPYWGTLWMLRGEKYIYIFMCNELFDNDHVIENIMISSIIYFFYYVSVLSK